MIDDYDLIVASFQSQYGLRLSKEIHAMQWDEFKDLLVGIGPETPLGRIVSIRAEEDKEILKHFSEEQHRIRNEWRARNAKKISKENLEDILNALKNAFISMAGR